MPCVCVCWVGTACAVWQLPVLGTSLAPPLEKTYQGVNSCAPNSVNKQKHKQKKPEVPKFPISAIYDLPLFHLGKTVLGACPSVSCLQTLWSVNRQTASVIPAVETCLKGSSDSLRSAHSESFSGLTSSKCRRDTPSACWIRGRVYEI